MDTSNSIFMQRRALTKLLRDGAAHLKPLALAARDYGVELLMVPHDQGPFLKCAGPWRPSITVVCDDPGMAQGPSAFDLPSLEALFQRSDRVIIHAWATTVSLYVFASLLAVQASQNVVIIETRLSHEQEWIDFISEANSNVPLTIATPMGSSA
jgi:hypothetical protein